MLWLFNVPDDIQDIEDREGDEGGCKQAPQLLVLPRNILSESEVTAYFDRHIKENMR